METIIRVIQAMGVLMKKRRCWGLVDSAWNECSGYTTLTLLSLHESRQLEVSVLLMSPKIKPMFSLEKVSRLL